MKIAVSGYFLWVHIGHIEYLQKASKLGKLIVIVNNDKQQILKYGKVIVPLKERMEVIRNIKCVDKVVMSLDTDRTVCKTLQMIQPDIFANGGDRTKTNIPETDVCKKYNIKLRFGLGKKIQSSSVLLEKRGVAEIQEQAKKLKHCLCNLGLKCPCDNYKKNNICNCYNKIK